MVFWPIRAKYRKAALPLIPAALALVFFRRPTLQALGMAAGGAALAFCFAPLAKLFERRLSRPAAALVGVLTACGTAVALTALLLPMFARQAGHLAAMLPESLERLSAWGDATSRFLAARLPGFRLPQIPVNGLSDMLTGAMTFAGSATQALSRLSMMLVLSFFFLCDRDRLLLRAELLFPLSIRATAIRTGRALARELRLYLQGQLMVALVVGALAAAGLMLIGIRGAAVLGGVVGILNMVPYFGPFIGGVPAVLIALDGGWRRAALCAGMLALVQQLDSAFISPRIMGGVTGFSPATVLIAIYFGASLGGIGGMLIALPVIMSIRTVFRVFVQSYENI